MTLLSFELLKNYILLRGEINNDSENLFLFRYKVPIKPAVVRTTLKSAIKCIGMDEKLYDFHSLRVGRMSDLIKSGFSVDQVKRMGRWKSSAVYRYIKT